MPAKPKPNPKGISSFLSFFIAYKVKVMLDPIRRMGPIAEAPNVAPIPPKSR